MLKEVNLESWSREDLRKTISQEGKWIKMPKELDNFNSFDEIQKAYNDLGLYFMLPVRSKWTYDCTGNEFIERVKALNLKTEGKTEVEKWIITEANNHANVIQSIKNGSTIAIVE